MDNKLLALAYLVIVNVGFAQNQTVAVRGTLVENGKPITNAAVFLQSFDDDRCARLFNGKKRNRKSEEKVDRCTHDVDSTSPDAHGAYSFTPPKTGWCAVHLLWNIDPKPTKANSPFKEGQWGVIYAGRKDSTGKYDAIAQDAAFYFSGKEDAVRDFDTRH